jgi:hypothetical protein
LRDAIADGRTYQPSATNRGDFTADVHYDVFQVGVRDGIYLSEDYFFCHRLRALGFDIHIDPTIVTAHHRVVPV